MRRNNRGASDIIICFGILLGILVIILSLTGCNKQIIDTNYSFTRAYVKDLGDIDISSWRDFDESDMVQFTDKFGRVYLTHSSNVIFMSK